MNKSLPEKLFPIAVAAIVAAVVFGCTFRQLDDKPLTITPVGTWNDTMSTFPTLVFVLSRPLADSVSAPLEFQPYAQSLTRISSTRDTLFLSVPGDGELLEGNTAYTITAANTLVADNGSTLDSAAVKFHFITYPSSSGQNHSPANADTIGTAHICGINLPALDTDFYFCPSPHGKTLSVSSVDPAVHVLSVDVSGFSGDTIASAAGLTHDFGPTDTAGVMIAVCSTNHNSAAYMLSLKGSL